jgi:hypothetical protein
MNAVGIVNSYNKEEIQFMQIGQNMPDTARFLHLYQHVEDHGS